MSIIKNARMVKKGIKRSVEERGAVKTLLLPPILIPVVLVALSVGVVLALAL